MHYLIYYIIETTPYHINAIPLFLYHADTTRRPKADEDQYSFHFVTESNMKEDIQKHKFIEFGKHQNHYYGIKVESVLDVINSGKMCILDVHPQVCVCV